jgi:hypothetical protein
VPVSIAVDDNCQYLTQEQYVIFYITDSPSLRKFVPFIASFSAVKAVLNLFASGMSDRWGRKICWY